MGLSVLWPCGHLVSHWRSYSDGGLLAVLSLAGVIHDWHSTRQCLDPVQSPDSNWHHEEGPAPARWDCILSTFHRGARSARGLGRLLPAGWGPFSEASRECSPDLASIPAQPQAQPWVGGLQGACHGARSALSHHSSPLLTGDWGGHVPCSLQLFLPAGAGSPESPPSSFCTVAWTVSAVHTVP